MLKSRFQPMLEMFEARELPAAQPLPVLLVIADTRDFYYQEYNDTRNSLLAQGVPVTVAATTTAPSTPHAGTGQGSSSGIVTPNITLAIVNAANYSAIAFVGGWGASMYQYAFNDPDLNGVNNNYYYNSLYNGDSNLNDGIIAPQKVAVNNLINSFLNQDKPVAGVCHGVSVLAWARVNGTSPLAGKTICVPLTDGTPGMFFNGNSYANGYVYGQRDMALFNGANPSVISGQLGNPNTTADDVIVDGRIITAENQISAAHFGAVIAQQVIALANPTVTAVNVNDGVVQRSRVTSLTLSFSSNVNAATLTATNAITLSSNGITLAPGQITVSPTSGLVNSVRLTFNESASNDGVKNGSLTDGVWTLAVPSLAHSSTVKCLYGDADGNGTVNGSDFVVFGNAFGSPNAVFDFNLDGTIDGSDFVQFGNRFGIAI